MQEENVLRVADKALTVENRRRSDGRKKVIDENSSIKDIEKEAQKMVGMSRSLGFFVAADNLEYYLNGKKLPHTKTLSRRWLRSFQKIKDAERKNQRYFEKEIIAAVKEKKTYVHDYWDASISYYNAGVSTEELFFASGDSSIRTTGSFAISYSKEGIGKVRGTVKHRWHDIYDFHKGLGAYIPGFGYIPDSAMKKLVTKGNAAEYEMECKWAQELTAEIDTKDIFPSVQWYWRITI